MYEIVVGKQPTVRADYTDEQAHPASRKASEADKSAVAAIMEMNQIIRIAKIPPLADQSAVAAINRALRLAGVFRSSA